MSKTKKMSVKEFAKKYEELKSKALGIMQIHGIKLNCFDGIDIDFCPMHRRVGFCINYEIQGSGYPPDYDMIFFALEEMDNDLEYFQSKYDKATEVNIKEQEGRDLLGYQRVIERLNETNKDE